MYILVFALIVGSGDVSMTQRVVDSLKECERRANAASTALTKDGAYRIAEFAHTCIRID